MAYSFTPNQASCMMCLDVCLKISQGTFETGYPLHMFLISVRLKSKIDYTSIYLPSPDQNKQTEMIQHHSKLIQLRGLMTSALVCRSRGLESNPGQGHNSAVFLGRVLNSHSASLQARRINGYSQFNAGSNTPSRGEQRNSQSLHTTETWISSGL